MVHPSVRDACLRIKNRKINQRTSSAFVSYQYTLMLIRTTAPIIRRIKPNKIYTKDTNECVRSVVRTSFSSTINDDGKSGLAAQSKEVVGLLCINGKAFFQQ